MPRQYLRLCAPQELKIGPTMKEQNKSCNSNEKSRVEWKGRKPPKYQTNWQVHVVVDDCYRCEIKFTHFWNQPLKPQGWQHLQGPVLIVEGLPLHVSTFHTSAFKKQAAQYGGVHPKGKHIILERNNGFSSFFERLLHHHSDLQHVYSIGLTSSGCYAQVDSSSTFLPDLISKPFMQILKFCTFWHWCTVECHPPGCRFWLSPWHFHVCRWPPQFIKESFKTLIQEYSIYYICYIIYIYIM